ncbi:MAG TPA: glycoside hydrolase family 16 protein [Stellaceae bacterium]|jgi:beta-glucanase (GH16 family)|nr:glycoside hydrolase family 16 protein [Stellaceae bacterium]
MTGTAALTFYDEFNSLSLWNGNSGIWDTTAPYVPLNGNGYSLPSNGEQEWYINSTYAPTGSVIPWTIKNGILTFTGAPAGVGIQSMIDGYQYTSGQINTYHSFSQTYGFFEMRAELPAGQGLWPAFWLLPENGSWPPEIDAMEMLGNNPTVYYTSVHSGTADNEVNAGQANSVADTSTSFHSYGVDWEPNFITYYFDGKQVYQTPTPADMNTPMYMIANLAIGGYWPGDVDGTTPFPAQMQIDFVRAYSSLPSWIADGADPTDVNHPPGGGKTVYTSAAYYRATSGVQNIVMTGTAPQTVVGNGSGDTITSTDFGSTLVGSKGTDTLIAGHGADTLVGGGHDTYEFNVLPWNAGQIKSFRTATDVLNLTGIFTSIGYTGSDPIADGYLSFQSDGVGNTKVYVNSHSPSDPWPTLITTLDRVTPSSITSRNWSFHR